jgi:hypothetical protein
MVSLGHYNVIRADLIDTEREARSYYQDRLAGAHEVNCRGHRIVVFFEAAANHVYTEEPWSGCKAPLIRRRLPGGRVDERVFCLDRARLMDRIIPAIQYVAFSLPGAETGARENRLLHGPPMKDGRCVRVVLSPGPRGMWFCKSAYPLDRAKWMILRGARSAKFPP